MTTVLRRSARRSGRTSPVVTPAQSELSDHFEALSVTPSPSKDTATPTAVAPRRSSRVASRSPSIPSTPIASHRSAGKRLAPKAAAANGHGSALRVRDRLAAKKSTFSSLDPLTAAGTARAEALPGREQEFETLRDTLADAISTRQGGCICTIGSIRGLCPWRPTHPAPRNGIVDISGVPGTGKTATVRQCILALRQQGRPHSFDFLEINGMKLSDVGQAYSILWRSISGRNLSGAAALRRLTAHFEQADDHRRLPLYDS